MGRVLRDNKRNGGDVRVWSLRKMGWEWQDDRGQRFSRMVYGGS